MKIKCQQSTDNNPGWATAWTFQLRSHISTHKLEPALACYFESFVGMLSSANANSDALVYEWT